jgi:hypothetical protein
MRVVSIRILFICGLLMAQAALVQTLVLGQSATGNTKQATAANAPIEDPLLRLLVSKGLLTTEEAGVVLSAGTPAAQRDRLATLLKDKGLIPPPSSMRCGRARQPLQRLTGTLLTSTQYRLVRTARRLARRLRAVRNPLQRPPSSLPLRRSVYSQ